MNDMPEKYYLIHNNCQSFTIRLLEIICRPGRKRVTTSYGDLQMGFVPGQEAEGHVEQGEEVEAAVPEDGKAHFALIERAKELMAQKTPTVTAEDLQERKRKLNLRRHDRKLPAACASQWGERRKKGRSGGMKQIIPPFKRWLIQF